MWARKMTLLNGLWPHPPRRGRVCLGKSWKEAGKLETWHWIPVHPLPGFMTSGPFSPHRWSQSSCLDPVGWLWMWNEIIFGTSCSIYSSDPPAGSQCEELRPWQGHEEGGSAYAKAESSLRSPPGNSLASTPKTRVCLLYCFVLSPIPLTLWGAVPHYLFRRRS